MWSQIDLRAGLPASLRMLSLAAAAVAAFAWVAGGSAGAPRPIPSGSVALLAELCAGVESASYQVIANPRLNATLDAYGQAAERYDVSLWHEAFAAHFDAVSRNLLDEALFFDYDDPFRKRLGIGEEIGNAQARAIREATAGPASEASGRLVWLGLALGAGPGGSSAAGAAATRLCAARLVKRLADGAPIGVLVLLPESRRLAAAFEQALGQEPGAAEAPGEPSPGEAAFAFLVGAEGSILAGTRAEGLGLGVEEAFPGGGRILAQESLGLAEGSAELRVDGRRRAFAFARIPGSDLTLVVAAAGPPARGFEALRWAVLLGLAAVMALALKRSLSGATAASAAAVLAVADGTARPYQSPSGPAAGSEELAAGEGLHRGGGAAAGALADGWSRLAAADGLELSDVIASERPEMPGGTLPKAVVREALRASRDRLRACYESALKRDPEIEVLPLTARLRVGASGRVARVELDGVERWPLLGQCLAGVLGAVRFPRPTGGEVDLVAPFRFVPVD